MATASCPELDAVDPIDVDFDSFEGLLNGDFLVGVLEYANGSLGSENEMLTPSSGTMAVSAGQSVDHDTRFGSDTSSSSLNESCVGIDLPVYPPICGPIAPASNQVCSTSTSSSDLPSSFAAAALGISTSPKRPAQRGAASTGHPMNDNSNSTEPSYATAITHGLDLLTRSFVQTPGPHMHGAQFNVSANAGSNMFDASGLLAPFAFDGHMNEANLSFYNLPKFDGHEDLASTAPCSPLDPDSVRDWLEELSSPCENSVNAPHYIDTFVARRSWNHHSAVGGEAAFPGIDHSTHNEVQQYFQKAQKPVNPWPTPAQSVKSQSRYRITNAPQSQNHAKVQSNLNGYTHIQPPVFIHVNCSAPKRQHEGRESFTLSPRDVARVCDPTTNQAQFSSFPQVEDTLAQSNKRRKLDISTNPSHISQTQQRHMAALTPQNALQITLTQLQPQFTQPPPPITDSMSTAATLPFQVFTASETPYGPSLNPTPYIYNYNKLTPEELRGVRVDVPPLKSYRPTKAAERSRKEAEEKAATKKRVKRV